MNLALLPQVDVVGMLQGAQPYTGTRVQDYLTRTSAPPYTGSVQATPSAPTTPITSPIHPDSGALPHPNDAVSAFDVCCEVREGQWTFSAQCNLPFSPSFEFVLAHPIACTANKAFDDILLSLSLPSWCMVPIGLLVWPADSLPWHILLRGAAHATLHKENNEASNPSAKDG